MDYIKKIKDIRKKNFKKKNIMCTNDQDVEDLKKELRLIEIKDLKRISTISKRLEKDENFPVTSFLSFVGIVFAINVVGIDPEGSRIILNSMVSGVLIGAAAVLIYCFDSYFRRFNMELKFIQLAIKEIEEKSIDKGEK